MFLIMQFNSLFDSANVLSYQITLFRKLVAQHRELVEEVADKEQEFCLAGKNSNLKDDQELSSNIDRF